MKRLKIWKAFSLLVFLPMGLVFVIFTVVNRHPIILNFWPLPIDTVVPLSAVVMFSLFVGVIWGGAASWLAGANGRRRVRELTGRSIQAEVEVGLLKDKISSLETEDGEQKPTNSKHELAESPMLLSERRS